MVAQHKVDRFLNDFLDSAEVVAHIAAFRDVAADRHGVGALLDQCEEIPQANGVNKIQVDVSQASRITDISFLGGTFAWFDRDDSNLLDAKHYTPLLVAGASRRAPGATVIRQPFPTNVDHIVEPGNFCRKLRHIHAVQI